MRNLKVQYCSDIHLEKFKFLPKITPVADYLVLAGDIGHPRTQIYKDFMSQTSKDFKTVVLIDGNHEYDKYLPPIQRILPSNIIHLQNDIFVFPNRFFCFGTTLWTQSVKSMEYKKALVSLENFLMTHKQQMIVTHHLPSRELIIPKYKNHPRLDRFANDLDYLLKSKEYSPKLWICGHSHCLLDKQVGYTRCLINTFSFQKNTTINL